MGKAINHPVQDRVKLSFVIFDIRPLSIGGRAIHLRYLTFLFKTYMTGCCLFAAARDSGTLQEL